MRGSVRLGLASAVLLTACGIVPTEGTTIVWMDIAPDGTVSVGWGEPPVWGADLDPADGCGEPR